MALPLLNNAEAQTSGTTITNANTSGTDADLLDEVVIGANMTATFDSTTAAHGTNAFKLALTSTATAVTYVGWSPTAYGTADTHLYGVFYFRTNVTSIASSIRLVSFNNAGTVAAVLGCVNGNQGFQWRTSAAAVGTISGAISANTWYRVEFDLLTGASGAGTATVYVGDSTTPAGTAVSGTQSFGTTVNNVRYGFTTANFSSTSGDFVLIDSINLNNTGVPGPGPYTAGPPPAGLVPAVIPHRMPLGV